jgi:nitroimidazol reductase NimA-like FMN-containing flavoprotein (pyridoxamine 5'-phosphate oxidase superfamily)
MDELSVSQCWSLLRLESVGRIAVPVEEFGVDIFPVNFVVDGGSVVFRTAAGTKLTALTEAPRIAFEADGTDDERQLAWSVVLKGEARAVEHITEMFETFDLDLQPWDDARKPTFVRLRPAMVTGRRFPISRPSSTG